MSHISSCNSLGLCLKFTPVYWTLFLFNSMPCFSRLWHHLKLWKGNSLHCLYTTTNKILITGINLQSWEVMDSMITKLMWRSFSNMCVLSCSVCPALCNPMDCSPARLLCPRNFPGKNTGGGCHFLLQEIFSTQGWSPHLWVSCISRRIIYHCITWEAPLCNTHKHQIIMCTPQI